MSSVNKKMFQYNESKIDAVKTSFYENEKKLKDQIKKL